MFNHYHLLKFTSDFPNSMHVWLCSLAAGIMLWRCYSLAIHHPVNPHTRQGLSTLPTAPLGLLGVGRGGVGCSKERIKTERQRASQAHRNPSACSLALPTAFAEDSLAGPGLPHKADQQQAYSEQMGLRARTGSEPAGVSQQPQGGYTHRSRAVKTPGVFVKGRFQQSRIPGQAGACVGTYQHTQGES